MPTVKFNKATVLELIGKKIPDEQLADRISMLGTAFEGMDDKEITVEIFPNRPDLLSEQGLARALASFMNIKKGFKKYNVKKSNVKVIVDKSVKNIRPCTACAVVKGLKLTDEKIKEIIQIQEKLHITYGRNRRKAAIGIYPLEHIKPPIHYQALHPEEIKFKPLDMNKDLTGSQIIAIHPTGREYGHLIEGFDKYPVFLDSKFAIMSMPPIINSSSVGKVTTSTRDVFIECSGSDFEYLHTCINIIAAALGDMGGEIQSVEIYYPDRKYITPNLEGRAMPFDVSYVNKVLGLQLKPAELKPLLEQMGHSYDGKKALVPTYRADILHPIDLVEDIAIAYGYENIEERIAPVGTTAAEKPIELFKNKIRDILIGLGLIETKNYLLTNKDYQTKYMNQALQLVELLNSVTQEYTVLRGWLIPSLLETLKNNKHYDYPQNIFEIGTIFRPSNDYDVKVHETESLAITHCGSTANFTSVKQSLDILSEALGIAFEIQETDYPSFIKGRVAKILSNGEKTGFIGEVHPQVLANFSVEMPVAAIELNVTDLFRLLHFPADRTESVGRQERQERASVPREPTPSRKQSTSAKHASAKHVSHKAHKPMRKVAHKAKSKHPKKKTRR